MKASELIDTLSRLVDKHGDVKMLICYDDGYITDFDSDHVTFYDYLGTEENAIVIET